ncbi:MAG: MFS transporter [Candidatus Sumerlaeaceae bacterium]
MFFLSHAPVGILFPFFMIFLRNTLRLDDSTISFFTALSGLTILFFQQPWGYVADVLFPKKAILFANILISALLFWMLGTVQDLSLLLAVFFAFQIFSTPNVQLLHGLLFVHKGSERWFGTVRAYASLGFIIANTIVGIVADKWTNGNLQFIFPFYCAVNVIAALWLLSLPEATAPADHQIGFWRVQRYFLSQPTLRWFLLTTCVYQIAHSLSYSFQSFLIVELGADMRVISASYSLAAMFELPVFFLASRFIARFGETKLIAFSAAVQSVRWLLVWQAKSAEAVVLTSLLHCITFGLFYAAGVSYANSHAPRHLKASAQTLFALVYFGLANFLSNVLGGLIVKGGVLAHVIQRHVEHFVPSEFASPLRNLYLLSSLCACLAFFLALRLPGLERHRQNSLN